MLTDSTTNTVMNEDLIKELITSVVGEKVKDLQEQIKKSNLQSNREIKNVNESLQAEVNSLKKENESLKSRVGNLNDRRSNLEKALKETEGRVGN